MMHKNQTEQSISVISRVWTFILVLNLFSPIRYAQAHGISEESRATMADGGFLNYVWLGAEHMLTGYDHLLFLFGVIFFLTGFRRELI